jgi:flavorubredoxin
MCEVYPEMKLIGNAKTADYVERFYGLGDRMQVVADGDTLSLGKHTLSFHLTPMVHWPETMMTYDQTDKVLFAGDAFGGFGALPHGIFDDEVDLDYYEDEILRYFSNIVGKYAPMVVKAVEKLKDVPVEIIASTHGPVWRSNPGEIIDKYIRWSKHETEPGVVVAYASMYGNTQHMAQIIARRLAERGVRKVRVHDVSRTDVSYLIRDIWRYKVLAIGSPTYNQRVFPLMADLLGHLENKNMRDRALAIFGTYTWSGGGVKGMKEFADRTKWDLIEPVIEAQCSAATDDMRQCIELGDRIADVVEQAQG